MTTIRRLVTLGCALAAVALVPATASASAGSTTVDPGGFHLTATQLTVTQNVGRAVVTIARTDTTREAQIRYTTLPGTAVREQDYTQVKSMIDFMPGQSSATFSIPIVNHNTIEVPKTIRIALFGAHSLGMGAPSTAVLTIVSGAIAATARDPLNPLGLAASPPLGDPLTGAQPFIDHQAGLAAVQERAWRHSHPAAAAALGVIAAQPEVHRFGNWTGPNPGIQVSQYLERTQFEEPGTVPEFATYYVVDSKRSQPACGHYSDPAWRVHAYHNWIESLAQGVGNYRAVVFLEMDSLITVGCLSHHGLEVRLGELHDAINILSKVPHLVVYLDAGAADALPASKAASLLLGAGVSEIEGFFLNSTHFDWTSREIKYGDKISRLTGGKHFVVNTAENGQGPLVPKDRVTQGNEILCNPPGRGLGPKPTFHTGYPNVDAFAWIANPGKSGGECRPGAPPTGDFWPALAISLVHYADFKVR
jgi:endoglucanase